VVLPVVDQLPLGPLGTNCYLVRADRGASEAVVVDPSGPAAEIRLALASHGARCAAILVTHGHFDHILGLADLAEGTGAPVYAPAGERVLLEAPVGFAPPGVTVRPWTPDVLLEGGETFELAGTRFEVLSVPGHSPAHLAYAIEGALLSGDVLFAGSVGRTDLPGADWTTLLASLRALFARFPPETAVHPGHGPSTTLGAELAGNPFLAELRLEQREAAG
jgi:hydroxyacylglutathione hydrolase